MNLISRLRDATGPSRELDAEIAKLVGAPHGPWEHVTVETRSISYVDEQAPAYTASLDAAMTLAEPGWQVSSGNCGEDNSPWACVTTPDNIDHDTGEDVATEPLARCIALLKARGIR